MNLQFQVCVRERKTIQTWRAVIGITKMSVSHPFTLNKFALVKFTCNSNVSAIQTKNILIPKNSGKVKEIDYNKKWKVVCKQGDGESKKLKNFEATILLISSE